MPKQRGEIPPPPNKKRPTCQENPCEHMPSKMVLSPKPRTSEILFFFPQNRAHLLSVAPWISLNQGVKFRREI